MRQVKSIVSIVTVALAVTVLASGAHARLQDPDRVVPGGGITGAGWQGNVIDAGALKQGRSITDSKFVAEGSTITISAGPAGIYWNPAHTATDDFTVKATFAETNYLKHSNHPHPYGVFVGGSALDTPKPAMLYCSAYGNGTFIVRGFSPTAPNGTFQLSGRRGTPNEAIRKAGEDATVTQEIAMSVRGGNVECAVNGTVVATYPVADAIGDGKLASISGVAGIRVGHNLDVVVTGFGITK